MSLKNVLIIVDNIDESIDFYEELFGLRVITRLEGNVIMSEGLVLQDVDVWYDSTKIPTTPHNNMTELYFEDNDIEGIIEKLESGKYVVSYVTELMELEGGQKLVRFYDPSGNLIEVRTPVNHNCYDVDLRKNMQIFVDADACPVVDIVETIAEKYNISTTLLCDTNHILYSDYSEVIVVGAGADAVDYKLISICHKGDVVVSQDYGVAAMALGKGAYAIHQSGKWYTNDNIDQMLMERHLNKKARRSSHKNHMKGRTMSGGHRLCADRSGSGDPRKRTEEDDVRFAQSFEKLILMAKSKEGAQSGTI